MAEEANWNEPMAEATETNEDDVVLLDGQVPELAFDTDDFTRVSKVPRYDGNTTSKVQVAESKNGTDAMWYDALNAAVEHADAVHDLPKIYAVPPDNHGFVYRMSLGSPLWSTTTASENVEGFVRTAAYWAACQAEPDTRTFHGAELPPGHPDRAVKNPAGRPTIAPPIMSSSVEVVVFEKPVFVALGVRLRDRLLGNCEDAWKTSTKNPGEPVGIAKTILKLRNGRMNMGSADRLPVVRDVQRLYENHFKTAAINKHSLHHIFGEGSYPWAEEKLAEALVKHALLCPEDIAVVYGAVITGESTISSEQIAEAFRDLPHRKCGEEFPCGLIVNRVTFERRDDVIDTLRQLRTGQGINDACIEVRCGMKPRRMEANLEQFLGIDKNCPPAIKGVYRCDFKDKDIVVKRVSEHA